MKTRIQNFIQQIADELGVTYEQAREMPLLEVAAELAARPMPRKCQVIDTAGESIPSSRHPQLGERVA